MYYYYILSLLYMILCWPPEVAKLRRLYAPLRAPRSPGLGIFDRPRRSGNRIRIKIQSGFDRNFFVFVSSISPYAYCMRITHTHTHTLYGCVPPIQVLVVQFFLQTAPTDDDHNAYIYIRLRWRPPSTKTYHRRRAIFFSRIYSLYKTVRIAPAIGNETNGRSVVTPYMYIVRTYIMCIYITKYKYSNIFIILILLLLFAVLY